MQEDVLSAGLREHCGPAAVLKVTAMSLPLRAIAAVILATGASSHHVVADGQTDVAKVVVVLIDGRNGKPMAKQRLIVLNGPVSNNFLRNNPVFEAWLKLANDSSEFAASSFLRGATGIASF